MNFSGKVIAFDCDEVLVDAKQGMLEACANSAGVKSTGMTWDTYDHFSKFGLSHRQFLDALIEHRVLENAILRPGARAAVALARQAGLRTAIVTARGFHPNKRVTEEYFESHGMVFDCVKVVGEKETKVEAIKSLGEVIAYSDDLDKHLSDIKGAGINALLYLMHQPWNADCKGFDRVSSVPDYVQRVLDHYTRREPRARSTGISLI